MTSPSLPEQKTAAKGPPCPVCAKPMQQAHRPFCCNRCREVDLGRWLTGRYAIPGDPVILGELEGGDDG